MNCNQAHDKAKLYDSHKLSDQNPAAGFLLAINTVLSEMGRIKLIKKHLFT